MSETVPETDPVENHECDNCGQLDSDPMIHYAGAWAKDERITITAPSFHFDCLPDELKALIEEAPEHATTRAAVEAAESGIHGAELRAFIAEQPDDNNIVQEA